jgi:hypothetical protein
LVAFPLRTKQIQPEENLGTVLCLFLFFLVYNLKIDYNSFKFKGKKIGIKLDNGVSEAEEAEKPTKNT